MVKFVSVAPEISFKVTKSADQEVVASVALVDCDDMVFQAEAGHVYFMIEELLVEGDAAGDVDIAWSVPSGATMYRASITTLPVSAAGIELSIPCAGAGVTIEANERTVLIMGDTSGPVQLQFAQTTSNGTASKILANSMFLVERMT